MVQEVDFYRILTNRGGTRIGEMRTRADALRAATTIKMAAILAKTLRIEDFPDLQVPNHAEAVNETTIVEPLYQLENFLGEIYARHVFELEGSLSTNHVILDDEWRGKAGSYVTHIRGVVQRASDLDAKKREAILNRLNELQAEIDRPRTRMEAVTSLWLEATSAIGQGAKNLEPAVRLIERIAGSFTNLREAEAKPPQLQLPPPETLGLPDLHQNGKQPSDPGIEQGQE